MPSIRDVVQALSKRQGVDSVLVMGRDGLPIDSVCRDGVDAEAVAALVPALVVWCDKVGSAGSRGTSRTQVIECDEGFIIISVITTDAILALFVQPNTNVGSLLFELRRYQAAIAGLL